jgi:hypothetical protein
MLKLTREKKPSDLWPIQKCPDHAPEAKDTEPLPEHPTRAIEVLVPFWASPRLQGSTESTAHVCAQANMAGVKTMTASTWTATNSTNSTAVGWLVHQSTKEPFSAEERTIGETFSVCSNSESSDAFKPAPCRSLQLLSLERIRNDLGWVPREDWLFIGWSVKRVFLATLIVSPLHCPRL